MRYDVIVVGAGPAGSTTARECSGQGLSVLLIDRAEFPRDKPCGGGVTKRAYDLLPVDIAPVVGIAGAHALDGLTDEALLQLLDELDVGGAGGAA